MRTALSRLSGPSALIAVAGRIDPTSTTGLSDRTVRFRKYAVSSSVLVPDVITKPATAGVSLRIAWMRFASVSQLSIVMSELLTLTICSTRTSAICAICGTALTSCSPRIAPGL